MQAGFFGNMFSCKRIGLAEVWEKGKSKGSKGRGGKSQRSQGLGGQRARVRVLCSEDLYGWRDVSEEVTY